MPGAVLRHPGGRSIDEAEHVWLAWLTSNVSDIHGNADEAGRSAWGQPLVLGMLTAAVVIGLAAPAPAAAEMGPAEPADGWRSIRLHRAVVAGDTLRAESRFEAITEAADAPAGRVQRTISGLNQRDELVVSVSEIRRVRRRPPA